MADFKPDVELIDRYKTWVGQFDSPHREFWERLLKDNPESAMCEAEFWRVLVENGVDVVPGGDLEGKRKFPDFLCHKNGEKFYVEATCISIERATNATGLSNFLSEGGPCIPLNAAIYEEVRDKTPQCANVDAPALVGVGTFHWQASCDCVTKKQLQEVLTGKEMIALPIDMGTSGSVAEVSRSTELRSAVFLRPGDKAEPAEARLPVSGVLVGGFGCEQRRVYGLLHPNACRPFDRKLLDKIEFCQVERNDDQGTLSVKWG